MTKDNNMIYQILETKQYYRKTKHERFKISCQDNLIDFIREEIANGDRERVLILGTNTKNEVTIAFVPFVGTVNASVVHPREIFKPLIQYGCKSFFFCHNHPSGWADETTEDIEVTRRLKECGEIIGIDMLDAIIVTEEDHVSLRSKGYI